MAFTNGNMFSYGNNTPPHGDNQSFARIPNRRLFSNNGDHAFSLLDLGGGSESGSSSSGGSTERQFYLCHEEQPADDNTQGPISHENIDGGVRLGSPNPALNPNVTHPHILDKDYLMQFQSVFTDEPYEGFAAQALEVVGGGEEEKQEDNFPHFLPGLGAPHCEPQTPVSAGRRQPSISLTPVDNKGLAMGMITLHDDEVGSANGHVGSTQTRTENVPSTPQGPARDSTVTLYLGLAAEATQCPRYILAQNSPFFASYELESIGMPGVTIQTFQGVLHWLGTKALSPLPLITMTAAIKDLEPEWDHPILVNYLTHILDLYLFAELYRFPELMNAAISLIRDYDYHRDCWGKMLPYWFVGYAWENGDAKGHLNHYLLIRFGWDWTVDLTSKEAGQVPRSFRDAVKPMVMLRGDEERKGGARKHEVWCNFHVHGSEQERFECEMKRMSFRVGDAERGIKVSRLP